MLKNNDLAIKKLLSNISNDTTQKCISLIDEMPKHLPNPIHGNCD